MADKEIIIDGKGCRYKTWDKDCALTGDNHGDNMKPCKFIDEKNCYYKQLARKTQLSIEQSKELIRLRQELKESPVKNKNLRQECERLKWYLKEIRYDELKALDIEWDEYETHCIDSEYSNIINLVEEALKERSSEDCRYDK